MKDSLDLRSKYRPAKFRHLVQGLHDPTIMAITTGLARRIRLQAMLLRGPYGDGKTTTARLLGQRAACTRQELHAFEPCGGCEGCQSVMTHPCDSEYWGYTELDAQSASPRDMIARIMADICYAKSGGRIMSQRVVTLDEFHRLPPKDQEKFVKVIEDKGREHNTLFILCVAPDATICPAISQRCAQRRLRLPSIKECIQHLRLIARAEGRVLTHEDADLLASTAGAVPRAYLGLLQDAILFSSNDRIVTRESVITACDMLCSNG